MLRWTQLILAVVTPVIAAGVWVVAVKLEPVVQMLTDHIERRELHVPQAEIMRSDHAQEQAIASVRERVVRVETMVGQALEGISEIKTAVRERRE